LESFQLPAFGGCSPARNPKVGGSFQSWGIQTEAKQTAEENFGPRDEVAAIIHSENKNRQVLSATLAHHIQPSAQETFKSSKSLKQIHF
jgi:hypothetical protein